MDEKAQGTASVFGLAASREKYWEERCLEEKVQKLSEAIEYMASDIRKFGIGAELMKNHTHGAGGEITVPISRAGGEITVPISRAGGEITVPISRKEQAIIGESWFYKNPLGRGR